MQAWGDCGPGARVWGHRERLRGLAGRGHFRDEEATLGRGLRLGRVSAGLEAPRPPPPTRSPDRRPGAQEALEGLVGRRPRRLRPGTQHRCHCRRRHRHQPPPPARCSGMRSPGPEARKVEELAVATPLRQGKPADGPEVSHTGLK